MSPAAEALKLAARLLVLCTSPSCPAFTWKAAALEPMAPVSLFRSTRRASALPVILP